MDAILDDLVRAARRCERVARPFESGPLAEAVKRLHATCNAVGEGWSGSFIGYHAKIYTVGLRPRFPGEHFDSEWGGIGAFSSRSAGEWAEYAYEAVEEEILHRAGVESTETLQQAATQAAEVFEECRANLLPTFDAVLSQNDDPVLRQQRTALSDLKSHTTAREFGQVLLPKGQYMTRDSLALSQGIHLPHHLRFQVWLMERQSYGSKVKEVAKIARYVVRYLEQRLKMKGTSVARTDGKIFIGHGRSQVWRDLKDFIQDRLKLDWDEFNREPTAGQSTKERLEGMLDNACFAFLVMTAEDEMGDGKKQARANVIHEVGLFQGRLGFERAIVLLEEGCEEFSNIVGLSQIRFPKGNITAKTEEIRRVLEREQIVKS